jgi:hypothetical protein
VGPLGLSWGGIANGMYESAKSGLVGIKDLAVGQLEWEKRWLGDALHGDFSAALDDFSNPFVDAEEKAQRAGMIVSTVLGDAGTRTALMDTVAEIYSGSSQVTQAEMLGKLPAELLIAAVTGGAGEVVETSGVVARLGRTLGDLADALRAVEVRSPLVPVRPGGAVMGSIGIKGVQNPFVRTVPVEYSGGEFSIVDFAEYPTISGVPVLPGRQDFYRERSTLPPRSQADAANSALRSANPSAHAGRQIHEILPVKFGGDPVGIANKVAITPAEHYRLNTYFLRLQRYLEGKGK